MPTSVTMPRLGLTMTEGTVTEWKVAPGDRVEKGQVILIIESEKSEVEIEAFSSGVVAAIYVEIGTTVPVGELLAAVTAPGEEFDRERFAASFVPEVEGAPATARRDTVPASRPGSAVAPEGAGIKAAPAARALAKRLGVDLAAVAGTGPGGRITVEDVEQAGKPSLSSQVGGEGPPLLFVSGFAVDASGWRRQIDGLARSHTVITYDHRGIGASRPAPTGPLSIADLAADAHEILFGLGRAPAVIAGASMGAAVAVELALAHPEVVRGLVLVSPPFAADARLEAIVRSWAAATDPRDEGRIRGILAWICGRELLADPVRREATLQALRAMARRTPAAVLARHADALVAWLGSRTRKDLARIETPVLVVVGNEDLLTPPSQAEAVVAALPRARLERLECAGHALMIERADELNARIADFVRGLG